MRGSKLVQRSEWSTINTNHVNQAQCNTIQMNRTQCNAYQVYEAQYNVNQLNRVQNSANKVVARARSNANQMNDAHTLQCISCKWSKMQANHVNMVVDALSEDPLQLILLVHLTAFE